MLPRATRMPSVDPQAMYPPSPAMGGQTRVDSPDRSRDGGAQPTFVRGGPTPSHSLPHHPPNWMHSNGPFGHPGHGHPGHGPPGHGPSGHGPPPHQYNAHHFGGVPGLPEGNKQQVPPPGSNPPTSTSHYPLPHLPQHYPVGPPGAYHPQHQQHNLPPGYGGMPPAHMYAFRPSQWGYGVPAGFDQQHHRYTYPSQQGHMPSHLSMQQSALQQSQLPQQTKPHPPHYPPTQSVPSGSHLLPQQQSQSSETTEKEFSSSASLMPPPQLSQKATQQHNPSNPGSSDSVTSKSEAKPSALSGKQALVRQRCSSDDLDAERLKKTSSAELTLAEVKPIQSDFHFFVHDMRPSFQTDAEEEVNKVIALQKASIEKNTTQYTYLVNSNLNCRLMKAWEDLKMDERTEFMKKEEEDRRRFMDEDEVASRHCFTLTARVRSPSKNKLQSPKGGDQSDNFDEQDDVSESRSEEDIDTETEHDSRVRAQSPVMYTDVSTTKVKCENVATVSPKHRNGGQTSNSSKECGGSTFNTENIVTPPAKREDSGNSTIGIIGSLEGDKNVDISSNPSTDFRSVKPGSPTSSKNVSNRREKVNYSLKDTDTGEKIDPKRSHEKQIKNDDFIPNKKNRVSDIM